MKTLRRILFATAALVLFAVVDSSAQIVVRARLFHRGPEFVRPARPSARHIWVGPEWVEERGTYVERPGYWAVGPRPGAIWIPGHWANRPRGYVWVAGHWR